MVLINSQSTKKFTHLKKNKEEEDNGPTYVRTQMLS